MKTSSDLVVFQSEHLPMATLEGWLQTEEMKLYVISQYQVLVSERDRLCLTST